MAVFLWTIVIAMAAALTAEILAMGLLAKLLLKRARRISEMKADVQARVQLSRQSVEGLKQSVMQSVEVVRKNGQEMGSTLRVRFRATEAAFEDARRRAQRIGLRLNNEGVQTVEQHQRGEKGTRGGVWEPIRAVSSIVGSVGATLWLLRKVA